MGRHYTETVVDAVVTTVLTSILVTIIVSLCLNFPLHRAFPLTTCRLASAKTFDIGGIRVRLSVLTGHGYRHHDFCRGDPSPIGARLTYNGSPPIQAWSSPTTLNFHQNKWLRKPGKAWHTMPPLSGIFSAIHHRLVHANSPVYRSPHR